MDRSDHHPVLLLRLRRRKQLGLGRQQLGQRMQLRLWLRRLQRRMQLRLWLRRLQRRMQLRVQLQLRMQRLLLLSTSGQGGTLRVPRLRASRSDARLRVPLLPALQRDKRSKTMVKTSWWMSSGVRSTPPLAQLTTAQPWARAISPAHSRQRRR